MSPANCKQARFTPCSNPSSQVTHCCRSKADAFMQGLRREIRSRHRHAKPLASRVESPTHVGVVSPGNDSGSYQSTFQLDTCQQGTIHGQMVIPDDCSHSNWQQQQQGYAAGFKAESHCQYQSGRFLQQGHVPEAAKPTNVQQCASRKEFSFQVRY